MITGDHPATAKAVARELGLLARQAASDLGRLSVLQRPFANHWLNLAIVWELMLLGVIIYVRWFHAPFGTFSLSAADWLLVIALAFTVVPVLEAVKWMERHEWFGELV